MCKEYVINGTVVDTQEDLSKFIDPSEFPWEEQAKYSTYFPEYCLCFISPKGICDKLGFKGKFDGISYYIGTDEYLRNTFGNDVV